MIIYAKVYKGGVGKTTITKNLGHLSSIYDNKTLIVTFDLQNDSYRMLSNKRWDGKVGFKKYVTTGEENYLHLRDNLDYYPLETATFGPSLKKKIVAAFDKLHEKYDVIIIDGAPAGQNLLDKVGCEIADHIIVPMTMDEACYNGLSKFMETPLGKKVSAVIPNIYSGDRIESAYHEAIKDLLEDTGVYLTEPIKRISKEKELAHFGKSIFETKTKKLDEIKDIYMDLLEELANV